jgi:hypothetical protein
MLQEIAQKLFVRLGIVPKTFVRLGIVPKTFVRLGIVPKTFVRLGLVPKNVTMLSEIFAFVMRPIAFRIICCMLDIPRNALR